MTKIWNFFSNRVLIDDGQWICFWGLCNLPDTIGQKNSQIAQNFWAEMKTIFNIYKVLVIIEQNENSQNAKKNSSTEIFQSAQFFSAQMKKKPTFITFPSRLQFSKLPKNFASILENKSHEYFQP